MQGYEVPEPIAPVEHPLREGCGAGGPVRIRTPCLARSSGRDDKALETPVGSVAQVRNKAALLEWVQHPPFAPSVSGLGDGPDSGHSVAASATPSPRWDLLEGYHRSEQRHQLGGAHKR